MPYVTVNGYELFYEDDDFADPWRPHDTIVMQPNGFGDTEVFRPWVPFLAREYRVLRLDKRGNGKSSKPPPGYDFKLDEFISENAGFLDALGLPRVHWIGDSFGAFFGAALAAIYPHRVKSLVQCGGFLKLKPQTIQFLGREGYPDCIAAVEAMGARAYWHSGWLRNRPPNSSIWDDMKLMHSAEHQALMPTDTLASFMRSLLKPEFDLAPLLPRIKAPTLLLSPGNSVHSTPEEQRLMLTLIPNCQQVVFEGAGSIAGMAERGAEEALKFIRKHS